MTTDFMAPPPAAPAGTGARMNREAWRPTWSGVRLVAGLELRQRVRSTKWKWALASVAALIAVVTFLVWGAVGFATSGNSGPGDVVFGLVVFFILFVGLVVSPTLSATTINGDVRDGTLAPLQATALSAADIVVGKLLASWVASLAFLAAATPFIVVAYLGGSMPAVSMLVVISVLAIELLVVCALGLGWSALTARTAASAVLTYMTVAIITAVLPVIFVLLSAAYQQERTVTSSYREYVWNADPENLPEGARVDSDNSVYVCRTSTYTEKLPRTDLYWWLLAVNPYVIVADSAPSPAPSNDFWYADTGMLDSIKMGVRELRLGLSFDDNGCESRFTTGDRQRQDRLERLGPVWPWGLAIQAVLALGGVALGVRRVAVPYGKLPQGSRVA